MYRIFTLQLQFLLVLLPFALSAQVLPKDRSELNYRLIGFSFPSKNKTVNYTLEIAKGNYESEASFKKNIIKSIPGATNKIIAEVPSFGSQYTWCAVYTVSDARETATKLFHFSTGYIPEVDTGVARLRITRPASEYSDAYVFLDDYKTLYDMNGNPVWYLPEIEGGKITPRDLKLSPQGTITFMYDPPYEINYNGAVLWKAPAKSSPNKEGREIFHHEFTRLSNGHYMALGEDSAAWARGGSSSKNRRGRSKINGTDNNPGKKTLFGTLIEYDEQGNIVWKWNSSDYFATSDIRYFVPPNGVQDIDVHENSFYFDEKSNNLYVSFRNINRVLKVKYPEGNVIAAYGEKYRRGGKKTGISLFCGQHACKLSENGQLYLFNNNSCNATGLPGVVMMKEPGAANEGLKKVWEYECTMEGFENDKPLNSFLAGGNVEELPDHSLLVCMSGDYCKIFIVSPDKQILWSAIPEWKNATTKSWRPITQYRASIIKSRKEMERLIWNAESHTPLPVAVQL